MGSVEEALLLLKLGLQQRHVAGTKLNYQSSRSHSIYTIKCIRTTDSDKPSHAMVNRSVYKPCHGQYRSHAMVSIQAMPWSVYKPCHGQYTSHATVSIQAMPWSVYKPCHGQYTSQCKHWPLPLAHRISIIDLAGTERSAKTGAQGQRVKEAGKINQSLMVLGRCITAMRHNQTR